MKTCLTALRLSAVAFVIPFAFVFSPALLGQATPLAVAGHVALLFLGISVWAVAVEGYFLRRILTLPQKLLLGFSALLVLLLPSLAGWLRSSEVWPEWQAWGAVAAAAGASLVAAVLWALKSTPEAKDVD